MCSFLISLASTLLLVNSQYTDVCFWGADNTSIIPSQTAYNGLYRFAGIYNNDSFYRLDRTNTYTGCNGDYIYMYNQGADDVTYPNQWVISGTPPGNDVFFYGVCSHASISPLTCGVGSRQTGTWTISTTEQQRAYTQADICPIKDCASITVSATNRVGGSGGCEGAVTNSEFIQTGPNMFTGTSGLSEWVWWFNPLTFQWVCTRTRDASGFAYNSQQSVPNTQYGFCPESLILLWDGSGGDAGSGRKLEQVNGYEGPFTGNHADSLGSGAIYSFTCIGPGTGATFTKSPTTPRPTLPPTTPDPTFAATNKPTTALPTTTLPTTALPTTNKPTLKPTTLNPTTVNPTTSKPTTSKPTSTTSTSEPSSTPTFVPSMNPTKQPTLSPLLATTTATTENTNNAAKASTLFVSSRTNVNLGNQDTSSSSIEIGGVLFGVIVGLSLFDVILFVCCIYYIMNNLILRTKEPGNASFRESLKHFDTLSYIGIILEIFDVITDWTFGVSLIVSNNNNVIVLGWISLIFAVLGLSAFFLKYITYKKLFGYQVAEFKKELKSCDDSDKQRNVIIEKIRYRTMDIDVLSLLNGCIEDIPQTLIVLVVISSERWQIISVLSITLSMASFVMKLSQIIGTKYGCKDASPSNSNKQTPNISQIEMNIATETQGLSE